MLLALAMLPGLAPAYDLTRPEVVSFIDEMVSEHGMEQKAVADLLANARFQQSIVDAMSRPAEKTLEWHEYRKIFVNEKRIAAGIEFWRSQRASLRQIAAETGVPERIIVGILGVETYYGRIKGKYRVIDALATLAFDYPPRSAFFRRELEHFLLLAGEEGLDPLAPLGSYAGAMGSPQFISSSYRQYAVDGGGDGRRDLWDNWDDIFASVANYFVRHGWRQGEPVAMQIRKPSRTGRRLLSKHAELPHTIMDLKSHGIRMRTTLDNAQPAMLFRLEGQAGQEYWVGFRNFYVITRYNRSLMYAMAVRDLGDAIAVGMEDEQLASK